MIELILTTVEIAFERLANAVKIERESRNKPSWDFGRFFLLQEEVAILYEALGLHRTGLTTAREHVGNTSGKGRIFHEKNLIL